MKYSPMPIIVAAVVVIAIIWAVMASSRAQVDRNGTAKCSVEKTRDECLTCCGRYDLISSFSSLGNECKCLNK
jgi:hypothetical protein